MPNKNQLSVLVLILVLTSCQILSPDSPDTNVPAQEEGVTPTIPELPTEVVYDSPLREITILYTNDEHGYMDGAEEGRGAANLMGIWREKYDYSLDGPFLVLSGGDNWYWWGEAISTWYKGEPMVEIMNSMGYDAAALGNHELDFGLETLNVRTAQMDFPLLAANFVYASNDSPPGELSIFPYTILDVHDVKVGIIGLTTISLLNRTNLPEGIDILDYQGALLDTVPIVMDAGVDLVLVISHLCSDEIKSILADSESLDLDLFTGGHCHEVFSEMINDTVIFSSGFKFENYSFASFEVNIDDGNVSVVDFGTNANEGGESDPMVGDIIAGWHETADSEIMNPIGYLQNPLELGSTVLETLTAEVWLTEVSGADIAFSHVNSIQDGLQPGDITISDIISVLPFDNRVVQINIIGQDVLKVLDERMDVLAIGGLVQEGSTWKLRKTGEPIDPNKIYTVLVDEFLYSGGDEFKFHEMDPDGFYTGLYSRQLFINWIIAQNSSSEYPLDEVIDNLVE